MKFFLCINNEGNPASLEVGKVYRGSHEPHAKGLDLLRVIDESGEDYLYPTDQFVVVQLPRAAKNALLRRWSRLIPGKLRLPGPRGSKRDYEACSIRLT